MKIDVHLPKLWPKNKVAVFWNTVYIGAKKFKIWLYFRHHIPINPKFGVKEQPEAHLRVPNLALISKGVGMGASNFPKLVKLEVSRVQQGWLDAPVQVKFDVEEHTIRSLSQFVAVVVWAPNIPKFGRSNSLFLVQQGQHVTSIKSEIWQRKGIVLGCYSYPEWSL